MKNSKKQGDLDIVAAPFLIIGTLWTLAGTVPFVMGIFIEGVISEALSVMWFTLVPGTGLLFVGIGVMKRWRFMGIPAMVFSAIFLLNFPLGTLLGGWALYSLWKTRRIFYPFDKKEKGLLVEL